MGKEIQTEVLVSLDEVIDSTREQFLDLISILAVEHDCLEDIIYAPIGINEEGLIRISVSGIDNFQNNSDPC